MEPGTIIKWNGDEITQVSNERAEAFSGGSVESAKGDELAKFQPMPADLSWYIKGDLVLDNSSGLPITLQAG